MTLLQKQSEFVGLFNSLGSWQERFQYLVELGNELPAFPEHLRCPATQIMTCTSQTFFYPFLFEGTVHIQGWSNSAIISGFIAMFQMIFNGCQVDELWEAKILKSINFHTQTGLVNNLTAQRKVGLLEMLYRTLRL